MHVAVAMEIKNRLIPGLEVLHRSLSDKAEEFNDIVKIGRTHTQVSDYKIQLILEFLVLWECLS